ncbi:hypothetical protein BU15DRAFT_41271 [Melanogaster broomeanus]|nr:hypothetical protein BU15DRAFT_41271 [Melanogaster broomeanus]
MDIKLLNANRGDTRRKRSWSTGTQSEEDDTDKEDAHHKRSKAASDSGGRAPRRTEMERRRQLEEDALCTNVMPHSVQCNGCKNIVKLHPRTIYGDGEWLKHRRKCPQITGVKIVHIRTKTASKTLVSTSQSMPMIRAAEGPEESNENIEERKWTEPEKRIFDATLRAFARWEVDYTNEMVRAVRCEGRTEDPERICKACRAVMDDESFKRSVRRKAAETKLDSAQQHDKLVQREKFTPLSLSSSEARTMNAALHDPLVFDIYQRLNSKDGDNGTDCFLALYRAAQQGKLSKHETFRDICKVFEDKVCRNNSSNPNLKYGVRYNENFRNFMILMRGHGGNSARQYGILQTQIGGPSIRTLRTLVANSEDALSNPELVFENVARVKRFVDAIKYCGPVAVGGDCTKVRPRLTYSNDYGSHIIGSVLPLNECEVDDGDDIENVIKKVKDAKAIASQVRAIIIKPAIPQTPPLVVALIPTIGKDTATEIHNQKLVLLKMAAQLHLPVVSFAADGAASELSAQSMMDKEASECTPLTYDYPLYGIHLRAPVFKNTGPLVSITDPPHARKTSRNQPQHGTHTASLGVGYIVNRSLVNLYEIHGSGLMLRDVENVDKQDDGAARRLYAYTALDATCEKSEGEPTIRNGFEGLFWYPNHPFCPWLLGTEFVEHFFGLARTFLPNFAYAELLKMVQNVMVRQKLLLNRDFREVREKESAAGYSFDYDPYPLTATHLRKLRANLTSQDLNAIIEVAYREAAQICKDILRIRVPALRDGHPLALAPLGAPVPKSKRLRKSATGSDDPEEEQSAMDSADESGDDPEEEGPASPESDPAQAAFEVATLSSLRDDLEAGIAEAAVIMTSGSTPSISAAVQVQAEPSPSPCTSETGHALVVKSTILDENGKASVALMLKSRLSHESKATVRSERVVLLDPKFALHKTLSSVNKDSKMTVQEASHCVRIAQALDSAFIQARKARELHWQSAARAIAQLIMPQGLPDSS